MGDDETTNEEAFAHDLMAAGYQKPNSEAENIFLRNYDLSRDDTYTITIGGAVKKPVRRHSYCNVVSHKQFFCFVYGF